jgi:hypothetical protein
MQHLPPNNRWSSRYCVDRQQCRWSFALHDPLVGRAGAMALEELDLNMIERVDL